MLLYIMSTKEAMGDLFKGGEEHKEHQTGGIAAKLEGSVLGGRRRRRSSRRKSRKSRRKSRKARRRRSRRH
jgi:hypothetical protein